MADWSGEWKTKCWPLWNASTDRIQFEHEASKSCETFSRCFAKCWPNSCQTRCGFTQGHREHEGVSVEKLCQAVTYMWWLECVCFTTGSFHLDKLSGHHSCILSDIFSNIETCVWTHWSTYSKLKSPLKHMFKFEKNDIFLKKRKFSFQYLWKWTTEWGCYNGETQREKNNGKMMQNEKCHFYSL